MHWGVALSLTLITGILDTGVWNCFSPTNTGGRGGLTGVGMECPVELEFSKFMTGLDPVQCARVSSWSGSQIAAGSDTSPALHRDS